VRTASIRPKLRAAVVAVAVLTCLLAASGRGDEAWTPAAIALALGVGWQCWRRGVPRPDAAGALVIGGWIALALLSYASIAWAPIPQEALSTGSIAAFAAVAVAWPWTLGRRALDDVLAGIAAGGTAAAAWIVAVQVHEPDPLGAFVAGRLSAYLQYPNAVALLLVACSLAAMGVAIAAMGRWSRAGWTAAAAGMLALASTCESRGAIVAIAAGCAVLLLAVPRDMRLRGVAIVVVVVASVEAGRHWLARAHSTILAAADAANTGDASLAHKLAVATDGVRTTCIAACAVALVAGLVVFLASVFGERRAVVRGRARMPTPSRRVRIVGGLLLALLVLAAALPWAQRQASGCLHPPTGDDSTAQQSRTSTGGTNRCGFYRAALRSVPHALVLGHGGGSFSSVYAKRRDAFETPDFAHSWPIDVLVDGGIVGGLALACLLAGVLLAAWRRLHRPDRMVVDAAACAIVVATLANLLVDWTWHEPAATLPAWLALGVLSRPVAGRPATALAVRLPVTIVLGLLVLVFATQGLAALE
jgi:hypothetical protein